MPFGFGFNFTFGQIVQVVVALGFLSDNNVWDDTVNWNDTRVTG